MIYEKSCECCLFPSSLDDVKQFKHTQWCVCVNNFYIYDKGNV